jgi:predicted permease
LDWCLACSNLASLLLARATERRKEMAIRIAVGAGRGRLVRQLLTESVILSLLGGAAGFLLALWANNLLRRFRPPVDFALNLDPKIDYTVLLFAVVVSLAAGIAFGLAPALHSSRTDLVPALKDEATAGRISRTRLRSVLVATQVALSLVLLVAAGLILRSLQHAEEIDPGFNPRNGVEMTFDVGLQGYDHERGLQFMREAVNSVSALPGVTSTSLSGDLPLGLDRSSSNIYIEGHPWPADRRVPSVLHSSIWPGYFKTMSIQLTEGRSFTYSDDKTAPPVVIVNQQFAREFFPHEDPIGKRVSFGLPGGPWRKIVGVARDGKYLSLDEEPRSFFYFPLLQHYESYTVLVARVEGNPRVAIASIRNTIQALDPALPITDAKTLEEHMGLSLFPARVAGALLAIFGLLALTLAAIGIYGVVSYTAKQRTREIGIRMALGARKQNVLGMIVIHGMTVVSAGLVVGFGLALMLTRFLSSFLYGVSPTDPFTFICITTALAFVAFVASCVPALRAADVDPMRALRYE